MPYKDPEVRKQKHKLYYEQRRALFAHRWNKYYKIYPERRVLHNIMTRCYNSNRSEWKNYGGRGIKCEITSEEIRKLMIRDKYWKLKNPTIDRMDNDGNYNFGNCRFIENKLNISRQDKTKVSKAICQYSLDNIFIKKFKSIRGAAKELNIYHQNITHCLKGRTKQGKGFIWRYNE